MNLRPVWIAVAILAVAACSWADKKETKNPASGASPIDENGRFAIIRALDGEFVFVRKPFPMGTKGLVLTPDGRLIPDGQDLQQALAINGRAAMPGDRARITNLIIKKDMIIFEINGGPVKKKKWWQRIEIGGSGGMTTVSQPNKDEELAQGSYLAVEFDKFVPEISPEQLKERIAGIFDFHAKTSLQAYLETIPPKAREAIKEHRVLVGMNRQMVLYSLGRPEQKIRENDNGQPYEEWMYGAPPQEVKFVRFVGDEVIRMEIMQVDGQKIVRTAKEIDLKQSTQQAEAKPEQPVIAPTLRRPGESADTSPTPVSNPGTSPSTNRPQPDIGDPSGTQIGPAGPKPYPR